MKETIQTHLEEQFSVHFGDGIESGDDLFENGVIDSFGLVDLVSFLEKSFDVHFTDEELMSPLMASLDGMVEMITSKKGN